ncbi:MAG: hypothetical protein AAF487_01585 [Bacteroidota bacterium]
MKLGLLGKNIGYSLSPLLHRTLGQLSEIDISYDLIDFATIDLKDGQSYMDYCLDNRYDGLNVTIPLKLEMRSFLEETSIEVSKIGAVNTLNLQEQKIQGYNTDFFALKRLIKEKLGPFKPGDQFLIAGAGGFAKAAAYALGEVDELEVFVVNRTFEKAIELADELSDFGIEANAIDQRILYSANTYVDGLMNATPIGMGESLEMPFDIRLIKEAKWAIESIYTPQNTMFLNTAIQSNCKYISGLEILFHQGCSSFEIWTGREINREKAWQAFNQALQF